MAIARRYAVVKDGKVVNVVVATAEEAAKIGAAECPEWVSPGAICERAADYHPAPEAAVEEAPGKPLEHVLLIVATSLVPAVEEAVRKALDDAGTAWQAVDYSGGGTALVALAPAREISHLR